MDFRRYGARFLFAGFDSAEGLAPEPNTLPCSPLPCAGRRPSEARTYVSLKARLLPPRPREASFPGGYDFTRDAWFAQLGSVGNVLGRIEMVPSPEPPGLGGFGR